MDQHALRHSAASGWARRGVSLVIAQRMLEHLDMRLTSAVYVHAGVQELKVAIDGAPAVRDGGRSRRNGRPRAMSSQSRCATTLSPKTH